MRCFKKVRCVLVVEFKIHCVLICLACNILMSDLSGYFTLQNHGIARLNNLGELCFMFYCWLFNYIPFFLKIWKFEKSVISSGLLYGSHGICPIYSGILKSFVWSSFNYLSMFLLLCLFTFAISLRKVFAYQKQ